MLQAASKLEIKKIEGESSKTESLIRTSNFVSRISGVQRAACSVLKSLYDSQPKQSKIIFYGVVGVEFFQLGCKFKGGDPINLFSFYQVKSLRHT